jgi:hypothetical protein
MWWYSGNRGILISFVDNHGASNLLVEVLTSSGFNCGILVGVNETKLEVLNYMLELYFITIFLKSKSDDFLWAFTSIYSPTGNNPRTTF